MGIYSREVRTTTVSLPTPPRSSSIQVRSRGKHSFFWYVRLGADFTFTESRHSSTTLIHISRKRFVTPITIRLALQPTVAPALRFWVLPNHCKFASFTTVLRPGPTSPTARHMNEIWSGLRVMETGQPSNESVHASTTYGLDARPFSP